MRIVLPFIFTLVVLQSTIAQSLEGGYAISKEARDFNEGFFFWKDGEFTWFKFSGDVKTYGRGTFKIVKDSLILNFEKARNTKLRLDSISKTLYKIEKTKYLDLYHRVWE